MNIVYRKLMKFFKILPKENLNSACKRKVLQQKAMKKGVLRRPATLLKKRLYHMFSCEFCEISTNNFFTEHL